MAQHRDPKAPTPPPAGGLSPAGHTSGTPTSQGPISLPMSPGMRTNSESAMMTPQSRASTQQIGVEKAYYYASDPSGPPVSPRTLNSGVFPLAVASPTPQHPPATFDLGQTMNVPYQVKLVGGNTNPKIADAIAEILGHPLLNVKANTDAAGTIGVQVKDAVASHDVFVIQSCSYTPEGHDVNSSFLELLFLVRRLKLARAERVTAVVPYFPYARQDRKTDLRAPLSASAVAQMMTKMGVDRVVTLDLHAGQVQGCFQSTPLDNLEMKQEFAHWIKVNLKLHTEEARKKVAIVSPDAGGVGRARTLADAIGVGAVVSIIKRRAKAGVVATMETIGDVKGLTCIIVDDIADTAGTLCKCCTLLKDLGATDVYAMITHGVLSEPACSNITKCDALKTLVISDSLPQEHNIKRCKKLRVIPVAPLLAQVISRHHNEQSVSSLFKAAYSTPRSDIKPAAGVKLGDFPKSPSGPAAGAAVLTETME